MNKHLLFTLLLAFALLVLMHNASTPVFEAPDEVWHYAYVRWLATGHGFPSMNDNASGANQEVAQPPLYYAAAALLSAPFPDDALNLWSNPGFGYQSAGTSGDNKNMLVHTRDEGWLWRGGVLALHVTRLASLLFGLVTVVAAWGLGAEAFGTQRAARLTAMLVAFHPQFVFMCSVVSNDSAAAALSTAALWMVARVLRRGLTVRRAAAAGVLVGLAALTKTSAILLLPLAGATLAWAAWKQANYRGTEKIQGQVRTWSDQHRHSLAFLVVFGVVAVAVGGWWYGRNLALYGDPLGISNHADTPWGRPEIVSLLELVPELPLLLRSFWAAYGWGHVTWPAWVYWALTAGAGVLLVRSARQITRMIAEVWHERADAEEDTHLAILLLALAWCGGIFAALLQWMRQVEAPHGRLLFPAIGAWALLLANGMGKTKGKRGRKKAGMSFGTRHPSLVDISGRAFAAFMFILTALAPGARILATFAPPRLRTPKTVMRGLTPVAFEYENQARLLGVETSADRAAPGESITVNACWEGLSPMATDYTVFVHLIGPENIRVAERHTYPGLGRFPTSLWPAGRAFCDTYRLEVEPWADGPILYKLEIGLFDAATGERLPATRADGTVAEPPVVGAVSIVPARVAEAGTIPSDATFDQTIRLRSFSVPATAAPGETVDVALYWEALRAPEDDLIAFVHLWRPGDAAALAQHDGQPRQGWYPTTAWQSKDHIPDTHPLAIPRDLPPGQYPLWAGLYRAVDGTRVAAEGVDGVYLHALVPLGTLEIK